MTHQRNLLSLEEEKAKFGFDLKLMNQIEDEKRAITKIKNSIKRLEKE